MSLVALLLTVFCSIAILHFENDSNGNIKTAEDAIWWAFVTITTVGYGDRFPVTSEGRIIAAVLMSAGVGCSYFSVMWLPGSSDQQVLSRSQGRNPR
jgi:voltage-gated potassium channel